MMLPSPSSSPPRPLAFNDSTNIPRKSEATNSGSSSSWLQLPTPPKNWKRPSSERNETPSKRVKLTKDEESSDEEEDAWIEKSRKRFKRRQANPLSLTRSSLFSSHNTPSTRPILESFVSANKADLFRCDSIEDQFLTPPYACSYSHAAKSGGIPLLAVSTEEGTVHIFNTIRRGELDPEPSRTTLRPHENGIYAVKWSPSDGYLATASADRSLRISSTATSQLLHTFQHHTASIKQVAWHPSCESIVATGGRDGTIFIWDLRDATSSPAFSIRDAHETLTANGRRSKNQTHKVVTNLIFNEDMSLTSSGSCDGILRRWDIRFLSDSNVRRPTKSKRFIPSAYSPSDPTTSYTSSRCRGILSLTPGQGPTSGLLFALGADSRIHTYNSSSLVALPINFTDPNMHVNGSFYISSALSPCGRWLANGGRESAFLFDVATAARPFAQGTRAVELKAQRGEACGVDWAEGMLATCADDMTVRVWRPDVDVYRDCVEDPEAMKWKWSWSSRR